VGVEEASKEVGKICNAYKNDDIDLTILLTHIGFESDLELAKLLKPEWGVDMIIGGHSHTILEQPVKVNNVLIAQAGVGTNQIGRFDILVDDDTNSIVDVLMTLSLIIVGITGVILFFFFESGVRQGGYQTFFGVTKSSWNFFHEYIGLLMVFLMAIHKETP